MFLRYLHLFKSICGVDGAITYSLLSRISSALGNLITLVFIASFLTNDEQGYYYTFGSILALQVFFELGFSGILTQYVAHEVAHLDIGNDFRLSGESYYISRVSSLVRLCFRIYIPFSCALFAFLSVGGYIFFYRYGDIDVGAGIVWEYPWFLLCFGTSVMFVVIPLLALLSGFGYVKNMERIRLFQQITKTSLTILLLFSGMGLWSLGFALLAVSIISILMIFREEYFELLIFLYRMTPGASISYVEEIFPYQWRIAVSWISGYFIFQLFNPVLFVFEGATVAGQVGMTLAVLGGVSTLSMSWITTKVPVFSGFIARAEYGRLDRLFYKTLRQLSLVNLLLLFIFCGLLYIMKYVGIVFFERFLSLEYVILLSIVVFVNQFVFSWATYLRCHKKEPFLINSVCVGFLCMLSTVFLGRKYGVDGVVYGYFVISVFCGGGWAYVIFNRMRKVWHEE